MRRNESQSKREEEQDKRNVRQVRNFHDLASNSIVITSATLISA
jgi:hypothetical protein